MTDTTTRSNTDTQPAEMLGPGERAPDFTLKASSAANEMVSLSEFRGQPVILAFYPADWSPVCGDQLALYNQILPEFERYNAQLLGISVDNVWSHKAYAESRNLNFPLLADFHPKGEVCRLYGSYNEEKGNAWRDLYVIDGDGVISWSYRSPGGVNPGAAGILSALEELNAGESAEAKR